MALAQGVGFRGERIGPAHPVPVCHMKGERQHIRPAGQFDQQGVGGGRLGTAFGGEKFHDNRLIGKRRGEQVPQRQGNHDHAQHYFFLSRRLITKTTLSPLRL